MYWLLLLLFTGCSTLDGLSNGWQLIRGGEPKIVTKQSPPVKRAKVKKKRSRSANFGAFGTPLMGGSVDA